MTDGVGPIPGPVAVSFRERIKSIAEFLKSMKEIVAVIFATIACVVVAFNYFVTRSELEKIHCQLRTFLQSHSHEISQLRIVSQMERLDVEIIALRRTPTRSDLEDRKLFQAEADRTTFNNEGIASRKFSKELSDKLQAGECPLKGGEPSKS
jgi:hypothetical protein